jgi:hypothetical protein
MAGDTYWDNVHVCRKCNKANPYLVEFKTSDHYSCCWAPKYLGHMFGCANSTENK